MDASQKLFFRHYRLLTVEQRDMLEDWELILCDVEAVAFLPRLQRCFKRVDSLLTERGEAVKK